MKKITALLLAALLCLTMFGCGKDDDDGDTPGKEKTEQVTEDTPDGSKPDESKPDESEPVESIAVPSSEPAPTEPSDVPELNTVEIVETPTEPRSATRAALESFIASPMSQGFNRETEYGRMSLSIENDDTLLMTFTLNSNLTDAQTAQELESFNRDANDADLMPIMTVYNTVTGEDSLKLRIQIVDPDGKMLAEYRTTLHADDDIGTGSLNLTLEDVLNDDYVQSMIEQSQTDEMGLRVRAENGDTIVYEIQMKQPVTEQQKDYFKNMDESIWKQSFEPMLNIFRATAKTMGIESIKLKVRFLDENGDLIGEKSMQ